MKDWLLKNWVCCIVVFTVLVFILTVCVVLNLPFECIIILKITDGVLVQKCTIVLHTYVYII